jgi:putative transposase
MPRHVRVIFAGVPHHVTQRGNHRQHVFFRPGDQETYLRLLRDYASRHEIKVIAYCLMTNHVHLVVVPSTATGLHQALKAVHGQYAQRINRVHELKGHLWQGRYFSSALDPNYFRNAVRYVELNPLRAGLVHRAEDYCWSSAAAHCGLRQDPLLGGRPPTSAFADIADWSEWLAAGLSQEVSELLRRNSRTNLPCGSESFVDSLEKISGRRLRHQPAGRRAGVPAPTFGQAQLRLEESGSVPS